MNRRRAVTYILATSLASISITGVVPEFAFALEGEFSNYSETLDPGFIDVHRGIPFYDDIIRCYNNGYMPGGYNLISFQPNRIANRADFASLFFGMSGKALEAGNGTGASTACIDVDSNRWYSQAAKWCLDNNVMSATAAGAGTIFQPDTEVTREQAASLFLRFAKYKNPSLEVPDDSEITTLLSSVPDKDSINTWAQPAVAWFVKVNLAERDLAFKPQDCLTRAELANIAIKLQPNPDQALPNGIIVEPTAFYNGPNNISIVARATGSTRVFWEKNYPGDDGWTLIDAYTPYINISAHDFSQYNYRCRFHFADGSQKTAIINGPTTTPLSPTNGTYDYSVVDGVLTIASRGEDACYLPNDFFNESPWADQIDTITSIKIIGNIYAPEEFWGSLSQYKSLRTVDFSQLKFDNCNTMGQLFSNCGELISVSLGQRISDEAINLSDLFSGCEKLNGVSFKGSWKIADASHAFFDCKKLTNISGIDSWDTSKLQSLDGAFTNCEALETINISAWDTSSLNRVDRAFQGCRSLKTLDVSNWNVSKVTNLESLFENCESLEAIDLRNWKPAPLKSLDKIFSGCKKLKSLQLDNWDVSPTTSGFQYDIIDAPRFAIKSAFSSCNNLEKISLQNWKFGTKPQVLGLFSNCSSLTELNLNGWEKAKFEDISNLFNGCSSLESIPVASWDTSNLATATNAFRNCSSLKKLNLSQWNTPKLENCVAIFAGCDSLQDLDLSKLDTSTAKNADGNMMSRMFEDCYSLTELKLGDKFKFASYPMGLRNVPKGMQWNANSASTSFSSTAELIDFQNSRTNAGAETYTLVKSDSSNPGGSTGGESGGGGSTGGAAEDETDQNGFQTVDETGGKFSASASGTSAGSIKKVESTYLDENSDEYDQLANKVRPGERPCDSYSIKITGTGRIVATFNIGKEFNGKVVRIVQLKNDGDITSSPAAVIDGTAAIIMNSSASVMIFAESEAAASFPDVPAGAWYVTSGILDYSVSHNLLGGYDGGTFGPNDAFTRGQTVTVLWRIAGCPEVESKAFDDVDYSQFYGKAVSWARKVGIAGGYEGTNDFGPNDPIGRAQLAVMLANYAKVIENMNPSGDSSSMAGKEDVASVPSWALDSMSWAVKQGIMSGRVIDGKEFLCPNDGAVRCEAAKMLTIFHRDVLKEG